MGESVMNPYFMNDKADGEMFQVYVREVYERHGKRIDFYWTALEQTTIGESKQGVEIKHDRRSKDTGNFYIEFEQNINSVWTPSGILRVDNTSHYIIGFDELFFETPKRILQLMREKGGFAEARSARQNDVPTKGFLVPIEDMWRCASMYCFLGNLEPNTNDDARAATKKEYEEWSSSRRVCPDLNECSNGNPIEEADRV